MFVVPNLLSLIPLILAALTAGIHWLCIWKKWRGGLMPTKVVFMLLLFTWVVLKISPARMLQAGWTSGLPWFVIGLFFCLAGDVMLELPPERWFKPGLLVFLVGQICYVFGFGSLYPSGSGPTALLVVGLPLLAITPLVVKRLLDGLKRNNLPGLRIPILIYAICITLMLYSAGITLFDSRWQPGEAVLVSLGALSFYISDIMNAWARFVSPISNHRLKIMSTYHLAQLLIMAGVAVHFS